MDKQLLAKMKRRIRRSFQPDTKIHRVTRLENEVYEYRIHADEKVRFKKCIDDSLRKIK